MNVFRRKIIIPGYLLKERKKNISITFSYAIILDFTTGIGEILL